LLHLWCRWLCDRGVLQNGTPAGYTAGLRLKEVAEAAEVPTGPVTDALRARRADLIAILRGDLDPAVLLDDPVLAPEALVDARPDVVAALAGLGPELAGRHLRIAEIGGR